MVKAILRCAPAILLASLLAGCFRLVVNEPRYPKVYRADCDARVAEEVADGYMTFCKKKVTELRRELRDADTGFYRIDYASKQITTGGGAAIFISKRGCVIDSALWWQ